MEQMDFQLPDLYDKRCMSLAVSSGCPTDGAHFNSRKIVGYEVYQEEQSLHLRDVVARAVLGIADTPRILHSDNGSPMKGIHLLELCYSLGIVNT